jgi:hypothetical protein
VLAVDPPDPLQLMDHVFPFFNVVICGITAFHGNDVELAARTAAALGPYGGCWAHHYVGSSGPAALVLALCAAVVGDLDGAVALCEETEAVLERCGCNGPLPRVRLYHAEILLRRGTPGDPARARELTEEVRRGAADLDAPHLAALADDLDAAVHGAGR